MTLLQQTFGIKRLWKALHHSWDGIACAWMDEPAFRLELCLTLILIPIALAVKGSVLTKALLIGSWGAVLVVELINSAIEAVVDRIGLERHPLSKKAKDLGSAAVFCAVIIAAGVWLVTLCSRI